MSGDGNGGSCDNVVNLTTTFKTEERKIVWTIKNMSSLVKNMMTVEANGDFMQHFKTWSCSTQFEVGQNFQNVSQWEVGLLREEAFKDFLCLYIHRKDSNPPWEWEDNDNDSTYRNDIFGTFELVDIKLPLKKHWAGVETNTFTHLFSQNELRFSGWQDAIRIKEGLFSQEEVLGPINLGEEEDDDSLTIYLNCKFQYSQSHKRVRRGSVSDVDNHSFKRRKSQGDSDVDELDGDQPVSDEPVSDEPVSDEPDLSEVGIPEPEPDDKNESEVGTPAPDVKNEPTEVGTPEPDFKKD